MRSGTTDLSASTAFVTGSISKNFTTLAVIQLVEAGTIDLDTGVSRYLEGSRTARPARSQSCNVDALV